MNLPILNDKELKLIINRMNLPANYATAVRSKIPEMLGPIVDKYTSSLEEYVSRGIGFVFSGKPGIGKTSAAAYLAKYARMTMGPENKFYTSYFIRAYDYKEKVRTKELYDEDILIAEWCRKVDFLVLDNLMAEDANTAWPGPRIYTELVAPRCAEGKATIITTNLTKHEFKKTFPELCSSIAGYLLFVDIIGADQRAENAKKLADEFFNK